MSTTIRDLYTPVERAILSRYLGISDPHPDDLAGLDPTAAVNPRKWKETRDGIGPVASEIESDGLIVENAVARICLEAVDGELPQWAAVSGGSVTLGRAPRRARARRVRQLVPRHLLTINWGDSGPGFSWPEAYWVTALPGYDVWIVTASADSPDTHGYCDFAIGWFRGASIDLAAAGDRIQSWWRSQAVQGQGRWTYIFDEGEIDEATAERWADAIWVDEGEDDEEELLEGDD